MRLDRRELANRIGSIGEFVRRGRIEETVLESETVLAPSPDEDSVRCEELKRKLITMEGELHSRVAEIGRLKSQQASRMDEAGKLEARKQALKNEIRAIEANRVALQTEIGKLATSIDGVPGRIIDACTNHGLYCLIAWRHACSGMVGLLECMHVAGGPGWHTPDPNERQNRKTDLKIAIEKEAIGLTKRNEKAEAEKNVFQGALNTFVANAAKMAEASKLTASKQAEVDVIDAKLSALFR